jgi:hypothetical protein
MTAEELAEATKRFDEPNAADSSRALTKSEKQQWKRVKRRRGRPIVGQGFQRVSVSMERKLLQRATALAKKRRMSRSKLLASLVEEALAGA